MPGAVSAGVHRGFKPARVSYNRLMKTIKFSMILGLSLLVTGVSLSAQATKVESKLRYAMFAGGCFWCMEPPFEKLEGVKDVTSGFSGGEKDKPSYKEVASGKTKHREVVQIIYDPEEVSYEKLLEVFWQQIDPTDKGGQFVDRGHQYSTAIFYYSPKQKNLAEKSIKELNKKKIFGKKIVTEVLIADGFHKAEDSHQDYYKKNPLRYKFYRYRSGRDDYLKKIWKDRKPLDLF